MNYLLICLISISLGSSLRAEETSDLTRLWQKLLTKSSLLREAEQELARQESLLRAQRGLMTPSVALRSEWFQSPGGIQEDVQTGRSETIRLRVQQDLFDQRSWVELAKQEQARERAALELAKIRSELLLNLALRYYQLQEIQLTSQLLEEAFERSLDPLEAQSYQVLEAGVRGPKDISLFLLQISQLRLKKRQLEPSLREGRRALGLLIEEPVSKLRLPPLFFQAQLVNLPPPRSLVAESIERLELKASDLELRLAESPLWPRLTLFGEWSRDDRTKESTASFSMLPRQRYQSLIGLSLDISLWSGLADFNQRKAAAYAREQTRSRLQRQAAEREALLADAEARLRDDYARFQETDRAWQQAKNLRTLALQRQEAGVASFDDRLGPELQYLELSILRLQAAFSYLRSIVEELHRRGLLLERELSSLEADALHTE